MRPAVVGLTWAFILAFYVVVIPARADEVYLKNGDLISGEIGTSEDGLLIVKTSYAKEVKVRWEEVSCLNSDRAVTLWLKNDEKLTGRVTCASLGQIQLEGVEAGEKKEFSIDELQGINPPPLPPPWTYMAVVNVGGAINKGNTDKQTLNSAGRFRASSEHHRIFAEGKYNYGKSEGVEDENNWLLGGKYNYFFNKKTYGYFRPLFEYDKFQDLNLRSILAAGPGYQFIDTESASLFAELGLAYINEDYDEDSDKEYVSGRWSVGADLDLIADRVKFFHFQEGYYDLTSSEGLYLRTEQGFRLPIVAGFSCNLEFDWSYKSDPPSGNKKSDTAFIIALGYEVNF